MDDKAQIMIIESIIFAIFIVLSLIFLYMIAPSGSVSNVYTDTQKIDTDNALYTMSENYSINTNYENYGLNELSHYILTNDYENLINRFDSLLNIYSEYNIWIHNSTKSMFWCNSSTNNYDTLSTNPQPLATSKSLVISTHFVAIPSVFRDNENELLTGFYEDGRYYNNKCDLSKVFDEYDGSVYSVVVELWET